jgi:hypothetical protein
VHQNSDGQPHGEVLSAALSELGETELKGAWGMKVFQAVSLVVTTLLFLGGIVVGQEQTADNISCAYWLQGAEKAKSGSPVLVEMTQEGVQRFAEGMIVIHQWIGYRRGYATGVIATTPSGPGSHLRDADELVTALDALCAGVPQKRLVDVALHALGRR